MNGEIEKEERMGKLLVVVLNAGDRERAHPSFRRKIKEACFEAKWLGAENSTDVTVSFLGNGKVAPGPVTVRITLPDGFKSPRDEDTGRFVKELGLTLGRFYFENGYGPRLVRVIARTEQKPLQFETPEEMLAQLRPGIDGVILCVGDKKAAFPPEKWQDFAVPKVFMSELAAGAGMDPRVWEKPDARVSTYQITAAFTTS